MSIRKQKIVYPFIPSYQTPSYWDKRSPLSEGHTLAIFIRLYTRIMDLRLKKRLAKVEGFKLDAGCGSGRLLSCGQIGIDFSQGMLARAKGKGEIIRASVTHLPFRDKVFDFAFSVDVALHLDSPRQMLLASELKRVAKKSEIIWPSRNQKWWP